MQVSLEILSQALRNIRPLSEFVIKREENGNPEITWCDSSDLNEPSPQEIENELNRIQLDIPLRKLRERRNQLLSSCDWLVIKAFCTQQPVPNEWLVYMQELRDLPSVSNPQLDENENIIEGSVVWPQKPS